LADRLGGRVVTPAFFNEFTVRLDGDAAETVERLAGEGILAGVPVSRLYPGAGLDDLLLVAVTETAAEEDLAALAEALS
ncbi:MAG: glycine dehydrogenase, partial [Alphaproteobacteria bacterium]|nr:glycine dehydrogenase [Alphaproteobacteria bacterium]